MIVASGNYKELVSNSDDFKELTQVSTVARKQVEERKVAIRKMTDKGEISVSDADSVNDAKKGPGGEKLVAIETQEVGGTKLSNYMLLVTYSGVGLGLAVLLLYTVVQVTMILCDWWVGIWGSNKYDRDNTYYIWVYAVISAVQVIGTLIRGFAYMKLILALARGTQMQLVWAILRAPLRWFDQTPMGRIINRACRDQSTIDTDIVWQLQGSIRFLFQILGSLILIGTVTQYFFIEAFILLVLYVYYYHFAIQASRDCRRMESVSKSPIFAQFGETLDGLTSVRAYGYSEMLDKRMLGCIATSNDAYFMTSRCTRWLNLRVDILAALAVAGAYYFAVIARDHMNIDRALIGLSLSQALSIVNFIGLMLMMLGLLDTKMNSVERIVEYIEKTPTEKDFDKPLPESPQWPIEGGVKFNRVFFRYRDELPNVIHGISLDIRPHEKVGIAGRTGSGKSTITLGMLRIIEPYNMQGEATEGRITIDGQDIEKLGLHVLRQKVAIIPQDAVLFSGTVGSNLDPYRDRTPEHDRDMINVLAKVQLLSAIYRKIKAPAKSRPIPAGESPVAGDKAAMFECDVEPYSANAKSSHVDRC